MPTSMPSQPLLTRAQAPVHSAGRISNRPMRSFNRGRTILPLLLGALLSSAGVFAQSTIGSACRPDEGVFFSCRLQDDGRTVSLCTSPKAAPIESVTFRLGTYTRSELTYIASTKNEQRFFATVSPVGPNASVRQVWFELKGQKYLVTACVGGDCPHRGGLIEFRGDEVLTSQPCATDATSHAFFSSEVVRFNSDLKQSHSNTDLIRLEDYDNNVNVLYPYKRVD